MKIPIQVIIIVLFFQLGGIESRICARSKTKTVDSAAVLNPPFDVLHYEAEILPDFQSKTLTGKVSIRLKILAANLPAIELDAKKIAIDGVTENDSSLNYQVETEKLVVRLPRPSIAGDIHTFTIRYRADATNFVRFFPDHLYAYYNAPNWMVCHFHPGDKATFDLRLTLPSDWKVAANGNLVGEKFVGANRKQYF